MSPWRTAVARGMPEMERGTAMAQGPHQFEKIIVKSTLK